MKIEEKIMEKDGKKYRRYYCRGLLLLATATELKLKEVWLETTDGNSYIKLADDGFAELLIKKSFPKP